MASNRSRFDIDYVGSRMPPPAAVKAGKVPPLSDEDRRTIARWIDLGCPIDLEYDPADAGGDDGRAGGWAVDENRPTLSVTYPAPGRNTRLDRILIGMHDAYTGLAADSFTVTVDVEIGGAAAGEDLAPRFKELPGNRWEWRLARPIDRLDLATLTVSVKDRQGNTSRIERTFSVAP